MHIIEEVGNVQVTHPQRLKTSQNVLFGWVVAYENLKNKGKDQLVIHKGGPGCLQELLITEFK